MANIAPIALLTVSKTELTYPENRITLDLSLSYDPNRRGVIEKYEFFETTAQGGFVFDNLRNEGKTVDVVFDPPAVDRTFDFGGNVTDKGGLSGEPQTVIIMVHPGIVVVPPPNKTIFGASGATIPDVATLKFLCGLPSVTRTGLTLSRSAGSKDRELETFINADIPVFWNLNYKDVGKDKNGNRVANPIPTGSALNDYFTLLEKSLAYYQGHPKQDLIICVCENEITTEIFHSGKMSDYGVMLKGFAQRCVKYGYKNITDSGVHVATILAAGSKDRSGKGAEVQELLNIFATMPELTRVNCHTNGSHTYNSNSVVQADQKAFSITGRHLWSNEFHATDSGGVTAIAQGWHDAGVKYAVYITGTDPNYELNRGTNLTSFGQAYKDFIKLQNS